jgi:hypothetical protein
VAFLLAVATLLAAPYVLLTTFSGTQWFDDEGTLLVGFRSLLEGRRMYDDIYSLYGPLFSEVYGFIYAVLHVPLTNTSSRFMAAAGWLAYTAGFSALCYRLTRSKVTTLCCYVLVLLWLTILADSPGHPQQISLILLAITLLLSCEFELTQNVAALAGIGIAIASLALIKINVGIYIGGAVALGLLRVTAPCIWTRIATPIVVVGLILMPISVEALLLDFWWVQQYVFLSTLTIGAAIIVLLGAPQRAVIKPQGWWIVVGSAGLTGVVVIGGMMLWGSSAYAILNAMILQNAHFLRNWYLAMPMSRLGQVTSAVSVLAALAYRVAGSWPALQDSRDRCIELLKLGFVLSGLILLRSPVTLFVVLVPFCWLVMVQAGRTELQMPVGRGVTGLAGAAMSLYPFPVAGQQLYIGALLPIIFIPILVYDLVRALRDRIPALVLNSPFLTAMAVTGILTFGAIGTLHSALAYLRATPLDLPGTSLIRVPESRADDLRWVAAQLSVCPSSYTVPGMWSFTLWANHALPTALNINDVLAFIQAPQQEEIVRALSRLPDLCVVYNPRLLQFFDRGQIKTDPPLLHYVETRLVPVAQHHDYIILKQPVSTVRPGTD